MGRPIYALAVGIKEQEAIINEHCFGTCGKIIVGGIVLGEGQFMPCRTPKEQCPRFDKEMDEAVGEINGDPVFVRKLK